ncbi:MAG TPA: bifunctional trypsin-like peptidase domain-containing/SEL1-like repeat protein [Gammaproteobacteria bacterium]|nr:bifunctional trypsin-like peptidase domain-containing/SEL1-like repeat protein [Gammaproteobacteria bacterium]
MRALITLAVSLVATMPAWAASTGLKPSEVFAADSPSIVVVVAYGEDGKAIAQGSGVVIAKDTVVSNCHVIEKADTAGVLYQSKHFATTLRYMDVERDLCSFKVKGLSAPPVRMGYTSQVQVGDAAYAIGAPEGLELTLSGGLISSLRKIPGGTVLQMTTPISPGSSGGGLFDAQGRLIGITSYYMAKGEQLNFALPVEWVRELPQHGKLASTNTKRVAYAPDTAHECSSPTPDMLIASLKGNYTQVLAWCHKAAAQGNAFAEDYLGMMYADGLGVPRSYSQALAWYRKAASQGFAEAQYELGSMYFNSLGVAQDYSQAMAWWRKAAAQGYKDAQLKLGWMYWTGQGVQRDDAQALVWFRMAAAQRVPGAEFAIGTMYYIGRVVPQDYIAAYALLNLAAARDSSSQQMRDTLISLMTPAQIAAGQALTREMQRIGVIKALDKYQNGGAQ